MDGGDCGLRQRGRGAQKEYQQCQKLDGHSHSRRDLIGLGEGQIIAQTHQWAIVALPNQSGNLSRAAG